MTFPSVHCSELNFNQNSWYLLCINPDLEKKTFGTFLLPHYHPFRLTTNIVFWSNMFLVTIFPWNQALFTESVRSWSFHWHYFMNRKTTFFFFFFNLFYFKWIDNLFLVASLFPSHIIEKGRCCSSFNYY